MKKVYLILLVGFVLSCEAVFVEDISNDSIVLQAPLDDTQVSSGNVSFNWQLLDEAELYQIQIAVPNFENASQLLLDSVTDTNAVVKHLDAGSYQWRVKGMNSEYETSYTTVSFTVN